MPGGYKKITGADGNTFSSENQPANPGRKKKIPDLDRLLADVLGSENPDQTEVHNVLEALLKQAKKGNVNAATVILNRAYGMPKQTNETTIKTDGANVETLDAAKVREMVEILKGNAASDTHTSGKRSKGS